LGVFLLAIAFATAANARSSLTTVWSFDGADGNGPSGPVVFDSNGAIYGTTEIGGTSNSGTVFELTPPAQPGGAWTENVLYNFTGGNDGRQPSHGVVFGPDGALYGTTYNGGGTLAACGGGCGVVFRLAPAWRRVDPERDLCFSGSVRRTESRNGDFRFQWIAIRGDSCWRACRFLLQTRWLRHGIRANAAGKARRQLDQNGALQFSGDIHRRPVPNADIAFDSQGNLYGTTAAGGTSNYYGTVFQLKPPVKANGSWTEAVLHNFTGGSDGGYPIGGVVAGANGNVYGTVSYSGVANDSGRRSS